MEQQAENKVKPAFRWKVQDKVRHDRGTVWYLIMTALAIALFIYSIFTANFLFAIMIILVIFIVIVKDYVPVKDIDFAITPRGIILNQSFYDFRDLKSFYIVYEPPRTKKIYFEFKSWRPDLSIDLQDNDPIAIREYLLPLLQEDLEKEDESTMDILEKLMKL